MISVTILVKNGERILKEVLESVKNFPEVVLLDNGSTDKTIEIAKNFSNISFYQKEFIGFGPMRNAAANLAKHDWILTIDADEVLSKELQEELLSLSLDAQKIYELPFENFYRGKAIRFSSWYPESHIRLYNKKSTEFSAAMLHEGILEKDLKVVVLKNPVYHYSYESLSDFLCKMERYSTLFAEQHRNRKKSSPLKAIFHGVGAFVKSYFLKRGFLGGYEGFLISIYNGHTAFYKYLKLFEMNRS